MRTSLVLTVIADDRPGIVEAIANRIAAAGANWEESRMARLAGKFAGVLRVSVDEDRAGALTDGFEDLRREGLTISMAPSPEPGPATAGSIRLDLIGSDRPGIIRDISRVLARQRVNIEALETDVSSAPMSGETLFRASATLHVPATLSLDALRTELEALADELMVDLTIDEADAS